MYNGCDTEALRQALGYRAGPDIHGQVAPARKGVQPHVSERLWEAVAGVITDKQDRLLGQRIENPKGPRFAGR